MISCGAVIQLTTRVEIIAEEEPLHNLHHHLDDDGRVDNDGEDDRMMTIMLITIFVSILLF